MKIDTERVREIDVCTAPRGRRTLLPRERALIVKELGAALAAAWRRLERVSSEADRAAGDRQSENQRQTG